MSVALANVAHMTLRIMSISSQIVLGGFPAVRARFAGSMRFQEALRPMVARKRRGAKRFPSINLMLTPFLFRAALGARDGARLCFFERYREYFVVRSRLSPLDEGAAKVSYTSKNLI